MIEMLISLTITEMIE
ncbi:MAG: hypothetical protein DKT66_21030 [Candidatus Melainabacteria bacterium]|nr:MAG: hypothetical protein DKT66_21030 [Candidatus Melainabacteria bacterium]